MMMHTPIDQQLQKPLAAKQQWVELIKAAINWKLWHEHGTTVAEHVVLSWA